MKLKQAQEIAERVLATLAPFCTRIEIAGSIRRQKPEVGDIEIVCIPKMVTLRDLLGEGGLFRDKRWSVAVTELGHVIKGNVLTGKYVQIELQECIKLDIFTAHEDNWGLILGIRTGSAEYAHKWLACGWCSRGYHSYQGMLMKDNVTIPVREEQDLFRLCGVRWVNPEDRNL